MPPPSSPLLIAVSARMYHPSSPIQDLGGIWTKPLHYLEQSVAQWLLAGGALPVMVPAVQAHSMCEAQVRHVQHYAQAMDALVLQGGNDVAPQSYGHTPMDAAWAGDAVRDAYEIALVRAFVDAGKPVFGICRGLQLLNVAFGGTLWQDIPTQLPTARAHVQAGLYERNVHAVHIRPDTQLSELYPGLQSAHINSIHHQAIRDLAPGFVVQAHCPDDGIIEAIRHTGPGYVAGVQWHPEFRQPGDTSTLDDRAILLEFLQAARMVAAAKQT